MTGRSLRTSARTPRRSGSSAAGPRRMTRSPSSRPSSTARARPPSWSAAPPQTPGAGRRGVGGEPGRARGAPSRAGGVRAPADVVVLAAPASACAELVDRVAARPADKAQPLMPRPAAPRPPGDGEPLRAAHVLAALAERLPPAAVLLEEAPSDRPEVHARI